MSLKNLITKRKLHKIYLLLCPALILTGVTIGLFSRGFGMLWYFTYLSNIFVIAGFVYLFFIYDKPKPTHAYLISSTMLAISVTGLIYNFILVPFGGNDIFYTSYYNFSNHVFSMVLTLANYFIFETKGTLKYRHLFAGLIFPLAYWLFFALFGGVLGFYPYFFMDIAKLGLPMALVWFAILLSVFLILGFILILFDNLYGNRINLLYNLYCRIYQCVLKAVSAFVVWRNPKVIEGVDSVLSIPDILEKKGVKRVLIVTGPTLYSLKMTEPLETALKEKNIFFEIFKDVLQNPTVENAENAAKLYKESNCNAIIALGGGSPIDCAKAAGARIAKPGKPLIKMKGVLKIRKRIPLFIAVPTTAGTGSETTVAAVLVDQKTHLKFAISDFCLIPDYAVLDPKLTQNLPKAITAATGMDALTHAIEAYISKSHTKKTDACARKAIILIKDNLLKAYTDGNDLDARKNMLTASYYAGLAFTKAYVGNVHAAAHTLSGFYGTPHGLANAVLLPVVLEHYRHAAHFRLAKIAEFLGLTQADASDKDKAQTFIDYIKDLNMKMQIPEKIEGIQKADLQSMIKNALKEANPLYPVPAIFTKHDFAKIFSKIQATLSDRTD